MSQEPEQEGLLQRAKSLAATGKDKMQQVISGLNTLTENTVEKLVISAQIPADTLYNAYDHTRQMLTGRTLTQDLQLTEPQQELLRKYLAAEILQQVHGPVVNTLIATARTALPAQENPRHLPQVPGRRTTGTQSEMVLSSVEVIAQLLLGAAAKHFEDRMIATSDQQINTRGLREVAQKLVETAVRGAASVKSLDDLAKLAQQHGADIDSIVAKYHATK